MIDTHQTEEVDRGIVKIVEETMKMIEGQVTHTEIEIFGDLINLHHLMAIAAVHKEGIVLKIPLAIVIMTVQTQEVDLVNIQIIRYQMILMIIHPGIDHRIRNRRKNIRANHETIVPDHEITHHPIVIGITRKKPRKVNAADHVHAVENNLFQINLF